MQKESKEPPLSLSQSAYLFADSYKELTKALLAMFGVLTVYVLMGIYFFFYENDPRPIVDLMIIFYVIYTPFLIWFFLRVRSFNRQHKDWNTEFVHNSYTLVFDTTLPKGNTTAEKILYFANMIFPELRKDYGNFLVNPTDYLKYYFMKRFGKSKEKIISQSMNYKITSDYFVDLALNTLKGYFIVKEFKDKIVTVQDIKYLMKIVRKRFKTGYLRQTNVFRIICVAKKYDQSFLNRESLERMMIEELKENVKIDLIVEEDIGYSVLWIS